MQFRDYKIAFENLQQPSLNSKVHFVVKKEHFQILVLEISNMEIYQTQIWYDQFN